MSGIDAIEAPPEILEAFQEQVDAVDWTALTGAATTVKSHGFLALDGPDGYFKPKDGVVVAGARIGITTAERLSTAVTDRVQERLEDIEDALSTDRFEICDHMIAWCGPWARSDDNG